MKLSVSLNSANMAFLNAYQVKRGHKSRSAVIDEALRLLAQREFESELSAAYAASAEQDLAMVREAEASYGDGLDDEAW